MLHLKLKRIHGSKLIGGNYDSDQWFVSQHTFLYVSLPNLKQPMHTEHYQCIKNLGFLPP